MVLVASVKIKMNAIIRILGIILIATGTAIVIGRVRTRAIVGVAVVGETSP